MKYIFSLKQKHAISICDEYRWKINLESKLDALMSSDNCEHLKDFLDKTGDVGDEEVVWFPDESYAIEVLKYDSSGSRVLGQQEELHLSLKSKLIEINRRSIRGSEKEIGGGRK